MFGNNFRATTSATDVPMAEEVEQLRQDATQTAADIIDGVQTNFMSNERFSQFYDHLNLRLNNIADMMESLNQRINNNQNPAGYERFETPKPPVDNQEDESSTSTDYDIDHDVIMRNRISVPLIQVPEPGFFSGKTSETELFCQLCEDTFSTSPNKHLPEETKIYFVKSRLRDSARNWYLAKYSGNTKPRTMSELLEGLKTAFSNIASYKLAKIKLMSLKQSYGKINDYIDDFRNYSRLFNWEEESLVLMFYNGLHPKYQQEIQKAEVFPTTLESIITTCILFENSINVKNKLNQSNNTRHNKKSNKNSRFNHNDKNNYKNNYKKNQSNDYNKNKHNNDNTDAKATKISSKN